MKTAPTLLGGCKRNCKFGQVTLTLGILTVALRVRSNTSGSNIKIYKTCGKNMSRKPPLFRNSPSLPRRLKEDAFFVKSPFQPTFAKIRFIVVASVVLPIIVTSIPRERVRKESVELSRNP